MTSLDYDREADCYDRSRGGDERAAAAAVAIEWLLTPVAPDVLVDVACGTGLVTTRLRHPARTVVGVDLSAGMIDKAAGRLPGTALRADATALPLASGTVDAVLMIWLLHLVPDPAPPISEAVRVLRPGGVLIATVDKNEASFVVPSDVAEATAALRRTARRPDEHPGIVAEAGRHGLRKVAEAVFAGVGQGRSPRQWRERIGAGVIPWATSAEADRLLAALPDQDRPRPDPVYRTIALSYA
ncbi:class I SAM-dependent methyltransferase [Micromonosporaceae bacterium Da 78-11]